MKNIILIAALLTCWTWTAGAQTTIDPTAVQQATDEMVALYQLTPEQTTKMYTIQERRFRNLAEIEYLKTQDYDLYLAKRRSVRNGTDGSIQRILTPEQKTIYNAQIAERRKRDSDKIREMRENGASKEEIQKALLELE
ncbi:MAG: hypothetical protein IPN33_10070 [Saprospiraceae bacterium]|nr:hypothetical protein [Saprospiraceae bacterium]